MATGKKIETQQYLDRSGVEFIAKKIKKIESDVDNINVEHQEITKEEINNMLK